jgi:hypothetical protein
MKLLGYVLLSLLAHAGPAHALTIPVRLDADFRIRFVEGMSVRAVRFSAPIVSATARVGAGRMRLPVFLQPLPLVRCLGRIPSSFAGEARTPGRHSVNPRVLRGEFMPVNAMSFPGINRRRSGAPKDVHDIRHRFRVVGIEACPVPAEMIELESLGDGPDQQLIGKAMGPAPTSFEMDQGIATAIELPRPNPTHRFISVGSQSVSEIQRFHRGGI